MKYRTDVAADDRYRKEFERLETTTDNPNPDAIYLAPTTVQPAKVTDGMIVYAPAGAGPPAEWNPGSGQGVYAYYNAIWNKL